MTPRPLRVLVMAAVVAAQGGACGGSAAPPPVKPEPEVEPRATRVVIEEPDQEEGVTIINARGRMDVAVIETGIAPHTQALTECYTTNLKRRRWLGGHVVLHWDIQKDGVISAVRLAESDLGNWEIERCLLEVARAATFGKPIGGDADFQIPLDFTAKGRALTWDADQALRAVGGQVASLDECADGGKGHSQANRKANGKAKPRGKVVVPADVTLTLYVGPGGKAQSVGFSGGSVIDDQWAECAERAALGWRLPDPRGQIAKLAVRYPMQ